MKKAFIVSLLLLTGCESKQVNLYIEQLEGLLKEYQAGVNGRIAAERRMYAEMAERSAVEAEREVYESLSTERYHQQRLQTAALVEKRMAPSQAQERMRDMALLEWEKTKEFFDREMSIENTYQTGLARVTLDVKKIQSLSAALRAMRETQGLPLEFAQAFQKEFQAEECKSIARETAVKEESLAIVKAEKAAEEERVKKLIAQRLLQEAGMATKSAATLAEEEKKLQTELAALQSRKCK